MLDVSDHSKQFPADHTIPPFCLTEGATGIGHNPFSSILGLGENNPNAGLARICVQYEG